MPSAATPADVFSDRQVLSTSHLPRRFDHRESEIGRLRTALSPALWSGGPSVVFLAGQPAQGKRTAVAVLCESITASTEPTVVPVDCTGPTTAYDLAISVTNTQRSDEELASSGHTRETAFRRMRRAVREADTTPIVRLDGVDVLDPSEVSRFLAGLLDSGSIACGVVLIADDVSYRNELPLPVRQRFHDEVYFETYDSATIREIIGERVTRAFVDGACPGGVIDACVDIVDDAAAPLRLGLNVLERAGEDAVDEGATTLTVEHLRAAHQTLKRERLGESIGNLAPHERRTLRAVFEADDGRFTAVYERYERHCEREGVDPNQERSVHNYLETLTSVGLVETEERRSSDGGRLFEYRCRADATALRDALDAVATDD